MGSEKAKVERERSETQATVFFMAKALKPSGRKERKLTRGANGGAGGSTAGRKKITSREKGGSRSGDRGRAKKCAASQKPAPDEAACGLLALARAVVLAGVKKRGSPEPRQARSSRAFASASPIFAGSLPAPRALSGRPPPLPPTIGATCWISAPALKRVVISCGTDAMGSTTPSLAPAGDSGPRNWAFSASTTPLHRPPAALGD